MKMRNEHFSQSLVINSLYTLKQILIKIIIGLVTLDTNTL